MAAAHLVPMRFVSLADTYTGSGEPDALWEKCGLAAGDIFSAAREVVAAK